MSENYEVKVVDSCVDLPDSRWADKTIGKRVCRKVVCHTCVRWR